MNSAAFSELYEDGLPRTVRFLLSLGFPRDTVNEIAQSAWSRAWERLDQLRDETKIVSWVNTIALNDARKSARRAKQYISFTPGHERVATVNVAAIDVAKILDMCGAKDRELLEAQLEGVSNLELAKERGVSLSAMRLRSFRARRAARGVCDLATGGHGSDSHTDRHLRELTERFHAQCITFAKQRLETVETFLRLWDMTTDEGKRARLLALIQQGIQGALKSLSRAPKGRPEVMQGRSLAMSLKKRYNAIRADIAGDQRSVA